MTTTRGGFLRSLRIAGAAFLLFSITVAPRSVAAPPPSIQAAGKAQSTYTIDTTQPVVFAEQSWRIVAPNILGPTVAVFSAAPFQNVKDPSSRVDAQLNLRALSRGVVNGWVVLVPQARTVTASGTNTASVAAASIGGNGDMGVTVSFLCHERPFLTDGVYETTVIGTITEAF